MGDMKILIKKSLNGCKHCPRAWFERFLFILGRDVKMKAVYKEWFLEIGWEADFVFVPR